MAHVDELRKANPKGLDQGSRRAATATPFAPRNRNLHRTARTRHVGDRRSCQPLAASATMYHLGERTAGARAQRRRPFACDQQHRINGRQRVPLHDFGVSPAWPVSPSKTASCACPAVSSWSWSAAQRARDISAGAQLSIDRDNDKNPVVALREIADGTVDLDHLRYELIHGLRAPCRSRARDARWIWPRSSRP